MLLGCLFSLTSALILTNQLGYQVGGQYRVEREGGVGLSIVNQVEAFLDDREYLHLHTGGFGAIVRKGVVVHHSSNNGKERIKVEPFDIVLLLSSAISLPKLRRLGSALDEGDYRHVIERFIVHEAQPSGIAVAVAVVARDPLDLMPSEFPSEMTELLFAGSLLDNGRPASYNSPMLIEAFLRKKVWHDFSFGDERGPQPLRWIVRGPLQVRLVDRYCPGDRFALILDDQILSYPTSQVEVSDACRADAIHSEGTYKIGEGIHSLQLYLVESPYGGGVGSIQFYL